MNPAMFDNIKGNPIFLFKNEGLGMQTSSVYVNSYISTIVIKYKFIYINIHLYRIEYFYR